MRFSDDNAVMEMLMNPNRPMKALNRTFSSFCQWCGDQRTPVRTATPECQVLMCVTCDLNEDD